MITVEGLDLQTRFKDIVNEMAIGVLSGWNGDFILSEFKHTLEQLQQEIKQSGFNFNHMPLEELKEFGVNDEGYVPIYLLNALTDGTILVDKTGENKIVGEDYLDRDTQFGYSQYKIVHIMN